MSNVMKIHDADPADQPAFWQSLIGEKAAADFLSVSVRTVQAMRVRGGGPRYVRMSARCIRYRRSDLRDWLEDKLRTSTSDAVEPV